MKLRTRYTQRYPTALGLVLDIPSFEGSGSKTLDLSGKGNHGIVEGATWDSGEKGVSMSYNGINNYVNLGDSAILNLLEAVTVTAQINIPSLLGTTQRIFHGEAKYGLYIYTNNKLYFFFYPGSPNPNQIVGATDVTPTNQWVTITGVWAIGEKLKLYIDGELINEAATTFTSIRDTNVRYATGRRGHLDMEYFTGAINNVKLYNTRKGAEEVKRRHEQPDKCYCRGS